MQSGYWQDLTTRDFVGIDPESTIALLPVAAVEQHGPHLPLATDGLIARALVRAALSRVPTGARLLVLPAIEIGHSPEHEGFGGTLSVRAETLLALWTDIGRCAAAAGLRKLVILNTHGGQKSIVDLVAMRLRAEHALFVVRANYFAFGAPPGLFDERELRLGLHGGDVETSLMLHVHPELVRTDRLADFTGLTHRLADENAVLGVEKPIGFGWMSRDLHPEGVSGNAAAATGEKGRRYLEHVSAKLAQLIGELAATPLDVLRA